MLTNSYPRARAANQSIPAASCGSIEALASLFSNLYEELSRLARYELARLGFPNGLAAKAILHETFDKSLVLEPFTQLRLLSKILKLNPNFVS